MKVRHRTHVYPEKVLANFLLEDTAIELYKSEYPKVEELAALMSGQHKPSKGMDELDSTEDGGGTQMLGKGRVPTTREWDEIKKSLVSFCTREGESASGSHWASVQARELHINGAEKTDHYVNVQVFTYASLRGQEIIMSKEHQRSRTRESCYLATTYEEDGQNITYIAVVQKLVKVVHEVDGESHCLRFALCDFYKRAPRNSKVQYLEDVLDCETGNMWRVSHADDTRCLSDKGYLVEMSTIATKVMKCTKMSDGGKTLYFIPYSFSSGLL